MAREDDDVEIAVEVERAHCFDLDISEAIRAGPIATGYAGAHVPYRPPTMPTAPLDAPVVVALHAAGVTLLVELAGDRLPAIVHWGPALPDLDAATAGALITATRPVPGPNEVDVPVRVAILPEHATGWTGRPGLQGSRDGTSWSTRFAPTAVTLDGRPAQGFVNGGPGVLEAVAVDTEAELELTITIELLPSGLVRSRAGVVNTGAGHFALDALSLAYPVPAEAGELLDLAGRWGRERVPQRLPFRVGTHLRENRRGRTGADSAYALHAGTPGFGFAGGEVRAVHTAWSGNHVHYAERNFNGQRLLGGGELLLPGEIRLGTGEAYTGPWIYGSFGNGLDAVARRFHAHLRARACPVSAERPITLNVWEAVYFDHDLDHLVDLAERAARVGVERYVLDDGWFGARRHDRAGLGDWVVAPDAWPNGLHPLVDHVRALGMQFGLWFEPEMVNPDSDVARAHPEWIMAARREWPVESRYQQVLNLGIPDAYEHVKGQLLAILDEYHLDFIKWDHNRDLVEAGDQLAGGRAGVHAQTAACYRLLDELRAAHPGLEIESCSSGGARIDLGVLERTDRVWVSDCIDPLERQHIMRWTAQLVPPEYLGSHVASVHSHTTGRVHSLSFRAGTALFGHLGIEWDLSTASEQELAELGEWLTCFKQHRQLLLGGDVVRMDGFDDHLLVHGVLSPDRSRAIFAMAVVGSLDASPGGPLRFRGLDPQRRYRVRPLLVGRPPSGLHAPAWWGEPSESSSERTIVPGEPSESSSERTIVPGEPSEYPGIVLSGGALEHVGVAAPIVNPDQVVLFLVADATDERRGRDG